MVSSYGSQYLNLRSFFLSFPAFLSSFTSWYKDCTSTISPVLQFFSVSTWAPNEQPKANGQK
jgi:hypothetical protein